MSTQNPTVSNFRISPSDLVYLYRDCKRCFYDKVKHQFKPPRSFSEHFTNADRAMRDAMVRSEVIDLGPSIAPKFRVIAQGEWVESKPIPFVSAGISISFVGQYDAVVVTEDDQLFVVDYKTTTLDDHALKKFMPQLMCYVSAIELPKYGNTLPAYVDGIAILVFNPAKFAYNPKTRNCGLYGRTRWVELLRDQQKFDELMQTVAKFISHPNAPDPAPTCEICKLRFAPRTSGALLTPTL